MASLSRVGHVIFLLVPLDQRSPLRGLLLVVQLQGPQDLPRMAEEPEVGVKAPPRLGEGDLGVLGVDSFNNALLFSKNPGGFSFFSTIVLSKNRIRFPWVSGGFLERRIPGKNGEGTPRVLREVGEGRGELS